MPDAAEFKVGVRVPAAGPFRDTVAVARRAEAVGLDMAWFPDSPLNYREVWSVLGAVAVSTERIAIGPAITNLASRHLTVTASAARALTEAAPGRFTLGIGAGDSGVGYDTLRPAKVAEMDEGVRKLRDLLSGGSVAYGTFEARLRDIGTSPPPIYLAAGGPKTLKMAGGVADGVIMPMGRFEEKMAWVKQGAEAAGRSMPEIFVLTIGGKVENLEESILRMKVFCARTAQAEGVERFEKAGFKIDGEFLAHKMGAEGDIGHLASVIDGGRALNDVISDELALWFMRENSLLGTEADVEAGLRRLAAAGVTGAYIGSQENSTLPHDLIEGLGPIVKKLKS